MQNRRSRKWLKTFKQSILDECNERKDEWAGQVRVHVEGAITDLHAADGRYHVDCMSKFMNKRSVKIGRCVQFLYHTI